MTPDSRILVTGASGLVGSAIVRHLLQKGYKNIAGTYHSRHADFGPDVPLYPIDFKDQPAVAALFDKVQPDYVFLAAARVGGIMANNTYRADFIHDNLLIHINIIHQSYLSGVKKLLYLGSTCIYPRDCPQPIKEEYLLTSPLEYTN
jgi:GDP-L-fucose synthase